MNLNLQRFKGISSEEARLYLQKFGRNELTSRKPSFFKVILSVLAEPMLSILVACGIIYGMLGDLSEAVTLSIAVVAVIALTIFQKNKSENALAALRELSPLKSKVIRDGTVIEISATEIVPNDIVFIKEGDRIPADGVLAYSLNLSVDESLLTGESAAVSKEVPEQKENNFKNAEYTNLGKVFSGSSVIAGEGIFRCGSTGDHTEIGKIGSELERVSSSESPLQTEVKRFTLKFSIIAVLLCIFIIFGLGIRSGNWLQAILAALTFSMAVLPEELPVVLSIFFSLGAWRISKIGVLTRNLNSIETLGAATVLCVDKTGTLTENRMKVRGLRIQQSFLECNSDLKEIPEEYHSILEFALLASKKDPYDPMEKAILDLGINFLSGTEHIHLDWELEKEYPLSPKLMALSYAWLSNENSEKLSVGAKGAPEAIFDLCHFSQEQIAHWENLVEEYSNQGFRILGIAKSQVSKTAVPEDQHDLTFQFLGLILLEDPIRDSVPASIAQCVQANIKVIVITGDHSGTARAVAKKIGLANYESVITGDELQKMSDQELISNLETVRIFSRIRPHQKLKIVRCLQAKGETVAMTGDGVNDALALQAAHIGISMGKRGTDVARQASDLVLLDDNFSSIVKAVILGRRIYANIRKSTAYIISVHVPIIGMSLLPALVGGPLFFFPAHVLLMELIIDPTCSIVFEGIEEERNLLNSPPRNRSENLISFRNVLECLLQGGFILIVLICFFFWGKSMFWSQERIRALGFLFLVTTNIGMMLVHLSTEKPFYKTLPKSKATIYWIVGLTAFALLLIFQLDFLRNLFGFEVITFLDSLASIGFGLLICFVWELRKIFQMPKFQTQKY
ncbi:cation transporter [Leptospira perolatii]|uniref:Cation transporter n=1 Tax=Leptospira perolatii TaxID=2023191 RepID=A0A2M9ZQE6_9LEPT|nr:cation-translocating P-type ATPase [Leptospira perolatii]PJZ70428.1 cation transporter [Leptospira perolatii]PJZ74264.1 cation transporter [Leptospira perolatii]